MMLKAKPLAALESVTDPGAFLARLEDLRADTDYDWASETLDGIYTTVTERGRVTAGQLRAIENIVDGATRGRWRR